MVKEITQGTVLCVSMNIDGSVHDAMKGVHNLTNSERIWFFDNGWRG